MMWIAWDKQFYIFQQDVDNSSKYTTYDHGIIMVYNLLTELHTCRRHEGELRDAPFMEELQEQ